MEEERRVDREALAADQAKLQDRKLTLVNRPKVRRGKNITSFSSFTYVFYNSTLRHE